MSGLEAMLAKSGRDEGDAGVAQPARPHTAAAQPAAATSPALISKHISKEVLMLGIAASGHQVWSSAGNSLKRAMDRDQLRLRAETGEAKLPDSFRQELAMERLAAPKKSTAAAVIALLPRRSERGSEGKWPGSSSSSGGLRIGPQSGSGWNRGANPVGIPRGELHQIASFEDRLRIRLAGFDAHAHTPAAALAVSERRASPRVSSPRAFPRAGDGSPEVGRGAGTWATTPAVTGAEAAADVSLAAFIHGTGQVTPGGSGNASTSRREVMQRTLERIQKVMDDPAERRTLRTRVLNTGRRKGEKRLWRSRAAEYRARLDAPSLTSRAAVAKRAGESASRAKAVSRAVALRRHQETEQLRRDYDSVQRQRQARDEHHRAVAREQQRACKWRTMLVHALVMPYADHKLSLSRLDRKSQLLLKHAVLLISSAWRRCAERLRQKIRHRDGQKHKTQAANLVTRFLRDHSSLAQGMNVVMGKYRRKVIHVQRMWRAFTAISAARITTLRSVWDTLVEEEYAELLGHCATQFVTDKRYGRQATLQDMVSTQASTITDLLRRRKKSRWRIPKLLAAVTARLRQLRRATLLLSDAEAKAREEALQAGVKVTGRQSHQSDDEDDEDTDHINGLEHLAGADDDSDGRLEGGVGFGDDDSLDDDDDLGETPSAMAARMQARQRQTLRRLSQTPIGAAAARRRRLSNARLSTNNRYILRAAQEAGGGSVAPARAMIARSVLLGELPAARAEALRPRDAQDTMTGRPVQPTTPLSPRSARPLKLRRVHAAAGISPRHAGSAGLRFRTPGATPYATDTRPAALTPGFGVLPGIVQATGRRPPSPSPRPGNGLRRKPPPPPPRRPKAENSRLKPPAPKRRYGLYVVAHGSADDAASEHSSGGPATSYAVERPPLGLFGGRGLATDRSSRAPGGVAAVVSGRTTARAPALQVQHVLGRHRRQSASDASTAASVTGTSESDNELGRAAKATLGFRQAKSKSAEVSFPARRVSVSGIPGVPCPPTSDVSLRVMPPAQAQDGVEIGRDDFRLTSVAHTSTSNTNTTTNTTTNTSVLLQREGLVALPTANSQDQGRAREAYQFGASTVGSEAPRAGSAAMPATTARFQWASKATGLDTDLGLDGDSDDNDDSASTGRGGGGAPRANGGRASASRRPERLKSGRAPGSRRRVVKHRRGSAASTRDGAGAAAAPGPAQRRRASLSDAPFGAANGRRDSSGRGRGTTGDGVLVDAAGAARVSAPGKGARRSSIVQRLLAGDVDTVPQLVDDEVVEEMLSNGESRVYARKSTYALVTKYLGRAVDPQARFGADHRRRSTGAAKLGSAPRLILRRPTEMVSGERQDLDEEFSEKSVTHTGTPDGDGKATRPFSRSTIRGRGSPRGALRPFSRPASQDSAAPSAQAAASITVSSGSSCPRGGRRRSATGPAGSASQALREASATHSHEADSTSLRTARESPQRAESGKQRAQVGKSMSLQQPTTSRAGTTGAKASRRRSVSPAAPLLAQGGTRHHKPDAASSFPRKVGSMFVADTSGDERAARKVDEAATLLERLDAARLRSEAHTSEWARRGGSSSSRRRSNASQSSRSPSRSPSRSRSNRSHPTTANTHTTGSHRPFEGLEDAEESPGFAVMVSVSQQDELQHQQTHPARTRSGARVGTGVADRATSSPQHQALPSSMETGELPCLELPALPRPAVRLGASGGSARHGPFRGSGQTFLQGISASSSPTTSLAAITPAAAIVPAPPRSARPPMLGAGGRAGRRVADGGSSSPVDWTAASCSATGRPTADGFLPPGRDPSSRQHVPFSDSRQQQQQHQHRNLLGTTLNPKTAASGVRRGGPEGWAHSSGARRAAGSSGSDALSAISTGNFTDNAHQAVESLFVPELSSRERAAAMGLGGELTYGALLSLLTNSLAVTTGVAPWATAAGAFEGGATSSFAMAQSLRGMSRNGNVPRVPAAKIRRHNMAPSVSWSSIIDPENDEGTKASLLVMEEADRRARAAVASAHLRRLGPASNTHRRSNHPGEVDDAASDGRRRSSTGGVAGVLRRSLGGGAGRRRSSSASQKQQDGGQGPPRQGPRDSTTQTMLLAADPATGSPLDNSGAIETVEAPQLHHRRHSQASADDEAPVKLQDEDTEQAEITLSPTGVPRPTGPGRRNSFFFMRSDSQRRNDSLAMGGGVDRVEAARIYDKVLQHNLKHWREACLSGKVKAALSAVEAAKAVAAVVGVPEDSLLPHFPPLLLQRKRMGLSTGGLSAALVDTHRRQRNRDSFLVRPRTLNPNALPLEYRPARPSDELANACLHALLMFRRWEHKTVHLPRWRAAESDRQREMLTFTADDIQAAMARGPDYLDRLAAARYMAAIHSRGRPPPLLVGLADMARLREQIRPLVRQALELAQTHRFLDVQEKRRTNKSRRKSIVELTAAMRR